VRTRSKLFIGQVVGRYVVRNSLEVVLVDFIKNRTSMSVAVTWPPAPTRRLSDAPHSPQNFSAGSFAAPHDAHRTTRTARADHQTLAATRQWLLDKTRSLLESRKDKTGE
jgi:hypothetical protein